MDEKEEMKSFRQYITEQKEGKHLYHATYRTHQSSIADNGLMKNSDQKNWTDSKKGKIYLAKDPHTALSYAETSEKASNKDYNSGIVVYKVNKKHLDKDKIHKDENVRGEGGETIEYHSNIPSHHLGVHSEHDT